MKSIVRTAQRNFHFASIYEHRKTNQLLVAGFSTLGQALGSMTQEITSSINDLGVSVERMSSTLEHGFANLNEHFDAARSSVKDSAEQRDTEHHDLIRTLSNSATREKKALQMLDNIQRHRRPTILDAS
jgi:hypothetical protein